MYLLYFAVFIILLAVELISYNLVTIWISIAALLTSVYAYFFPDQIVTQMFLLLIFSIVLIVLTKPIVGKMKYAKEKTNADRLIGMQGVVLEQIDSLAGTGQVKVSGQVWSAKTEDEILILVGETVQIENIEGVKLIVSRKEKLCRI